MSEKKERTQIEDIDRSIYDIKNKVNYEFQVEAGLTQEIVRQISAEKNEPSWMLDFRLKSLETYNNMETQTWGPNLDKLNIDKIISYIRPEGTMKDNWEDVDGEIGSTFERLGIRKAEESSLSGVGAQFDSEVVYHSVKKELEEQGVIYTTIEEGLKTHEDMIKKYFMSLVPPSDHKFAALHGAVWSGGSFVYVPKNIEVAMPLQSYFRMNAEGAGQFEHTLIIVDEGAKLHFIEGCSAPKWDKINLHAGCVELFVKDGASLRYSTIENWSKNMYNLNTKRALIGKNATMEWVSGSFGSSVSMLYPMTILQGDGAHMDYTGVTFAGADQELDTGAKVVHIGQNTSSNVYAKSISKSAGKSIFRSLVKISESAENAKSTVSCESLMLDNRSISDTIPVIDIENNSVDLGHEAKIGRISDEAIFYLMSRGITEEEAKEMIVKGFVDPVAKELPLEYAVEMNHLITLEFEGSIG